jgi:hypothetical protein
MVQHIPLTLPHHFPSVQPRGLHSDIIAMSKASEEASSFECGSELLKRQFLFDPSYKSLNHGTLMPLLLETSRLLPRTNISTHT